MKYRSHTCGELSSKEVGKKAILSGFVESIRIHGKIGFINLRDKYGITQVFLGKEFSDELLKLTREILLHLM